MILPAGLSWAPELMPPMGVVRCRWLKTAQARWRALSKPTEARKSGEH